MKNFLLKIKEGFTMVQSCVVAIFGAIIIFVNAFTDASFSIIVFGGLLVVTGIIGILINMFVEE